MPRNSSSWSAPRGALRTLRTRKGSALRAWWSASTAPGPVDWALVVVILAVAYVTFLYGDVRATFEHSFNFLDAVLSGHPRSFYTLSIEHTSTGHPAVYDIPLYAIFAVWNLPTYVIHRITGFDYLTSTPAELWLKTMMVLAALWAARLVAQIARQLGADRGKSCWAAFCFLTSMAVFMPVFVVVQYDIVLVVVMLLALRAYLADDLKAFIGWFVLANTLKLFALFIFIPLVLLREKRLRVAFAQLVTGLLGLIACRLLYHGDAGYAAATSGFTSGMMKRLVATSISWIGGDATTMVIPFFVVFMVGVAILAWAHETTGAQERNYYAVYLSAAVFLVYMTIVPLNPYWIALMAPFTVLVVFMNPRRLLLNTLLETAISATIVLLYMRVGFSMYNRAIFEQLLLPHLTPGASNPRYATPNDVLVAHGLGGGNPFIIGFLVACTIAFLVVNWPRPELWESLGQTERMPRSYAWFRLVPMVGFTALLLVTYFVPSVPVVYSTAGANAVAGSSNILAQGAEVTETVSVASRTSVSALAVGFQASGVQWIDSSEVTVALVDSQGREVMASTLPANSLGDGLKAVPCDGVVLEAGEHYTLRVTSAHTEGGTAHVLLNPDSDQEATTEDGRAVTGDLVVVIQGEPA